MSQHRPLSRYGPSPAVSMCIGCARVKQERPRRMARALLRATRDSNPQPSGWEPRQPHDAAMHFLIWLPLIEAFITSQSAAGAPATTCRARREHLAHMARRIPTSPEATGADELLAYFAAQAWAPETRRGRRTTMRAFWSWTVATGRLEHNIAEAIPRVKPGKPNPRPCPDAAYKRALLAAGQRSSSSPARQITDDKAPAH